MLGEILVLVVEILCGLVTGLLITRGLMRWLRISFISPLGQMILTATDWLVRPLRGVLPQIGRVDLSCWIPAWLVQCVILFIGMQLCASASATPTTIALLIAATGALHLVRAFIYLIMLAIFLSAILSWINPYAPIAPMVNALSRPFLAPLSRRLPRLGTIDLSPLVILILLQVLLYILARNTPVLYLCR